MSQQIVYILRSYNLGADGDDSQNDIVSTNRELFMNLLSEYDMSTIMQKAIVEIWDSGHLLTQSRVINVGSDRSALYEQVTSFINSIQI